MNEYRRQQLAAAALIDSGNYTAEQVAEVYGWIKRKPPERATPEQSEPQRTKPKRKSKLLRILRRLLK